MRLIQRHFHPGFWPTLAFLVLLPGLVGLGIWQLGRAEEKRVLFAQFAANADNARPPLTAIPDRDDARYRPVRLRGRYLAERQFLLDNRVERGRAGYAVLTPFRLESGNVVLVNRGWVPLPGRGREHLPDIAVDTELRVIRGRLDHLPRPGFDLGGGNAPTEAWPRVVQFPSREELSAALRVPLPPYIVLLDAGEPQGYLRNWRPAEFGPERHLAYAFQWFALALTLTVIYIAVNLRKRENQAMHEHPDGSGRRRE